MTHRFFFAKIGPSNSYANTYLHGKGELGRPAIPIYFNCSFDNEQDFLASNCAKEQEALFFECGRELSDKIVVVIHEGSVWLLQPCGGVDFHKSTVGYQDKGGFVKLLPVELVRRLPLAGVPQVLASIGANRNYSSGSFREITGIGNVRAIRSVLGLGNDPPEKVGLQAALECLSSVEFETLVAKLLEEAGLFVPAYRGGMMPDADLFVYNKSTKEVLRLGEVSVESGQRLSIQVKLKTNARRPPKGIDLLACCEFVKGPGLLGVEWLGAALARSPVTLRWLRLSLDWLPEKFLASALELVPPSA